MYISDHTIGSPAWVTSLTNRLIIHFSKTPIESLQDSDLTPASQIRYVRVVKSSDVASEGDNGTTLAILLQIQETGIKDVILASSSSSSLPTPAKPYLLAKRKRKRDIEAGILPGGDEEDEEGEEGEEMYSWEPGVKDD